MFGTIQTMIHRIHTTFGDSDLVYGCEDIGSWENYPQGVLQGNASGPDIWTALSSVIFDILHKRVFSCNLESSVSRHLFTLIGFSYVDDCDLL